MDDLDYTITKNKIEILILKDQESINSSKVTQNKLEAVEKLQSRLQCM